MASVEEIQAAVAALGNVSTLQGQTVVSILENQHRQLQELEAEAKIVKQQLEKKASRDGDRDEALNFKNAKHAMPEQWTESGKVPWRDFVDDVENWASVLHVDAPEFLTTFITKEPPAEIPNAPPWMKSFRSELYTMVLSYVDIKRAYFHGPARSDMYVEIPDEDWEERDEERCGKINMSLYRTREAALNWQEACIEFMEKNGLAT